jgi:hypothetical protein
MSVYLKMSVLFSALIFFTCNLEQEVEIDLPQYSPQIVVESYLSPGKPYSVLLTRSKPFFTEFNPGTIESLLNDLLENDADVSIRYKDKEIPLHNQLYYDGQAGLFSNYVSSETVPFDHETEFQLTVTLTDGTQIFGKTVVPESVLIDSIVVEYNKDSLGRVLTYFTDPPTETNFYRRMLHLGTLDSVPEQDFLVEDDLSDSDVIAFGTGFEYENGDTLINSIFHLTEDYHAFLLSVELSIAANLDPITQPGRIFSNVTGNARPLGIFTGLSLTRDTTIIGK